MGALVGSWAVWSALQGAGSSQGMETSGYLFVGFIFSISPAVFPVHTVCPWDGLHSDLPCGQADCLADERQCHIRADEKGGGGGTLPLVDRTNLIEFRKRYHFLKTLH